MSHNMRRVIYLIFPLYFAFLAWRIFSAPYLIANPTLHWNEGNAFDDSATVTSLYNYSKDGLFANYGHEDRQGMATHSLFAVPCSQDDRTKSPISYDLDLLPRSMDSLQNKCVYTRTPHLHLWIDYVFFKIFGQKVVAIKMVGLILLFTSLFFFYRFLRHFYRESTSLLSVLFFGASFSFWGWAQGLYNQSYQLLGISLFFLCIHSSFNRFKPFWLFIIGFFLSAISNEYLGWMMIYGGLWFISKSNKKVEVKSCLGLIAGIASSAIIFIFLKVLYLGSIQLVWEESLHTLSERYPIYLSFFSRIFASYQQLFSLVDTCLIPLSLCGIAIAFFVLFGQKYAENSSSRLRLIMSTFVAALSVHFLFASSAFYHPHLFYRHFIPFSLICFAEFGEGASWIFGLKIKSLTRLRSFLYVLVLLLVFIFAHGKSWQNICQLWGREIVKRDSSMMFSDYTLQLFPSDQILAKRKIQNFEKWFNFKEKNRLVDETIYSPNQSSDHQGMALNEAFDYRFDWFFVQQITLNKIDVYLPKDDVMAFEKSCHFYSAEDYSNLKPVVSKYIPLAEVSAFSRIHLQFPEQKIRSLRLDCFDHPQLRIYEVNWLNGNRE